MNVGEVRAKLFENLQYIYNGEKLFTDRKSHIRAFGWYWKREGQEQQ